MRYQLIDGFASNQKEVCGCFADRAFVIESLAGITNPYSLGSLVLEDDLTFRTITPAERAELEQVASAKNPLTAQRS